MLTKDVTQSFFSSSSVAIFFTDGFAVHPYALPTDPWAVPGFFTYWRDDKTAISCPIQAINSIQFTAAEQ